MIRLPSTRILDTILNRLGLYIEKRVELTRQVRGALVYPIAVVCIAITVLPPRRELGADALAALAARPERRLCCRGSHAARGSLCRHAARAPVQRSAARRGAVAGRGAARGQLRAHRVRQLTASPRAPCWSARSAHLLCLAQASSA